MRYTYAPAAFLRRSDEGRIDGVTFGYLLWEGDTVQAHHPFLLHQPLTLREGNRFVLRNRGRKVFAYDCSDKSLGELSAAAVPGPDGLLAAQIGEKKTVRKEPRFDILWGE